MFKILGLSKQYYWAALPLTGFFLGSLLDNMETERMSKFRDKSSLYGRELGPDEKPSW